MTRPAGNLLREGSVLMLSGTPTPPSVPLNLRSYWGAWKVIENSDCHVLHQDLRRAGWNLFFIAGIHRRYTVGTGGAKSVRRAIGRVLAKVKAEGFNCVQISEIVVKRFLGIPYVRVEAHSRHLQQSNVLASFKQRTQTRAAASWSVG